MRWHPIDTPYHAFHLFTSEECKTILSMCQDWHKCGILRTGKEEYIEGRVVDICIQDDLNEFVLARVIERLDDLNAYGFYLYDPPCDIVQVYRYPQGGKFGYHIDTGSGKERKLSIVVNLNPGDEYQGGDLRLYDDESPSLFQGKPVGTAVVFPSHTLHGVSAITSGVRYSMAIWLKGPPLR
jgi:hypothetical protein